MAADSQRGLVQYWEWIWVGKRARVVFPILDISRRGCFLAIPRRTMVHQCMNTWSALCREYLKRVYPSRHEDSIRHDRVAISSVGREVRKIAAYSTYTKHCIE